MTKTTDQSTVIEPRVDLDVHVPAFSRAMNRLDSTAGAGLDPRLVELVRTRASMINGCAYCVDMHSKDAMAKGETTQRLVSLPVWRETPYFTAAERAALALTEQVTTIAGNGVGDAVYAEAARHFPEAELASLIALVVVINAWNRIGVATRAWEPGSYRPGE
jgi:AhpD family alkylhydroperoxidase